MTWKYHLKIWTAGFVLSIAWHILAALCVQMDLLTRLP